MKDINPPAESRAYSVYNNWTKEQLIEEVGQLRKRKKYGLVWEDKPEDVVLQCQENIPVLKEIKNRKIFSKDSLPTNILIEGDNYHSLSVLNYTHRGLVDVIYADPPYNTGNKSWIYNNDYVEKDDSYRHSKWLSFIEKRARLSKFLLKDDGIFVLTIDDYELFTVGLLLDEIFGEENKIGVVVIETNPRGRTTNTFFATSHEYILFYAKRSEEAELDFKDLTEDQMGAFDLKDEISKYRLLPFRRSGGLSTREERPNSFYPIYFSKTTGKISTEKFKGATEILPIDGEGRERVWRQTRPSLMVAVNRGDIVIRNNGPKFTVLMKDRIKEGRKAKTVWIDPKYDASSHGTVLIQNILNKRKVFDYPKSLYAVIDTLNVLVKSNKQAIILDFFAGSGTTGQAVLEMNKQDGGNRKFILCTNNDNKICEEVTYERLRRVIKGYKNKKEEKVEGLGGNLSYFKTDLVNVEKLRRVSDEAKLRVTYQAGSMIALREDTLNELEKNESWQIFEGNRKLTAIYFTEDKTKLRHLINLLEKKNLPTTLYIFGWGKNEYKSDYYTSNIRVEDIPEPVLEVYKEINRI